MSLHCAAGGGGSFIAPVEQIHSSDHAVAEAGAAAF